MLYIYHCHDQSIAKWSSYMIPCLHVYTVLDTILWTLIKYHKINSQFIQPEQTEYSSFHLFVECDLIFNVYYLSPINQLK